MTFIKIKSVFSVLVCAVLLTACHTTSQMSRRTDVQPDIKPLTHIQTRPLGVEPQVQQDVQRELSWQQVVQKRLDSLMTDPFLKVSQLGLYVYDLTDDAPLYAYNESQRMRPASCQKVVTAVSALALLGTDYCYTPIVRNPGWGWCWDDAVTGITDFGRKGKRHDAETLYAETKERSLGEVLVPMMKQSDNLLAESMFWQLPKPGAQDKLTLKDCQERVAVVMRLAGLNPDDYVVADGSGLSLYNYISPYALVMLLRYAHGNAEIFNALYPALPIAGVDGTLQNRMHGTAGYENVRAKTGTVTGVSSLSGYVTANNGHLLCFSIINQGMAKGSEGRAFQDKICLILTGSF